MIVRYPFVGGPAAGSVIRLDVERDPAPKVSVRTSNGTAVYAYTGTDTPGEYRWIYTARRLHVGDGVSIVTRQQEHEQERRQEEQ